MRVKRILTIGFLIPLLIGYSSNAKQSDTNSERKNSHRFEKKSSIVDSDATGKYLARSKTISYRDKLVQLAIKEWNFFDQGALNEGAPKASKRIKKYFKSVRYSKLEPTKHYWSAAFISYLVKKAGAPKSNFNFDINHSRYIYRSYLNTLSKKNSTYYTYSVGESIARIKGHTSYTIKPGDLIGHRRPKKPPSDLTQEGVVKGKDSKKYSAHVDIVVAVHKNKIEVIGGNVGDSVTKKIISLEKGYLPSVSTAKDIDGNPFKDEDGNVKMYDWFVVLGDSSAYK